MGSKAKHDFLVIPWRQRVADLTCYIASRICDIQSKVACISVTPKQEAARPWNIFTGHAGRAARGVSLADGVRRLAYAAHEGGRPGGIRPHRRQRLQRPRSSVTGARRHIKKVFRHDNIHRCVRPHKGIWRGGRNSCAHLPSSPLAERSSDCSGGG